MPSPKGVVYLAIKREYKSHKINLERELLRRIELQSKLRSCDIEIMADRQALQQLTAFAQQQGWTERELDA